MIMKLFVTILAILFAVLQYKLWFEKNSVWQVWHQRQTIAQQTETNNKLKHKNEVLMAEITDLKKGQAAVEERARNDLGMTKPGEVFCQIVPEMNQ